MDQDKAVRGGVKAGVGLLALVSGRGGVAEAAQGVTTLLEAAGVVQPEEEPTKGKEGSNGKQRELKKEEAKAAKSEAEPLTEELKQKGLAEAAASIAREAAGKLTQG